ncbi:hypothetical protein AV274_1394 [Blastocystis sp. ATCC 50177/Nand II]|uniref:Uncharacterized protein n=1 Tax=Blastocystis sp. subtype 1 (strain ATCC 50177 / NandII) TaxID=478820 RepID=A0A196SKQ0_BLAHN|nr:hypothetical protein AV274_1394 [Blastocystis sp. ATCC 50177/Nand II]
MLLFFFSLVAAQTTINENTLWRYHIDGTAPQAGWNTAEFTTQWPTSTIANMPAPQGKAMYYCASFDVTVDVYATIRHVVTMRGGFAVFVNGVELGRSRLPTGDLTINTKPTTESETPISVHMGTSFGAANIKNTDNLVCVEVHTLTIDSANNFGYSVTLVGEEDDLVIDGDFAASHPGYHSSDWNELASNAYDKNNHNKFNTDDPLTCTGEVKACVQWTWKNERMEAINYLKFYRGTEANRDPWYISILASNDGNLWTEIQQWTTCNTWGGSYSYKEFMVNNPTAYRAYRVQFWGCYCEGNVMSEFYLGTRATVDICGAQEGYSASFVNSYARKNCTNPTYLGGLYRLCREDKTLDTEVLDQCVSPLPASLAFNTTTGVISGRIAESTAAPLTFTITAANDRGEATATITLSASIVNLRITACDSAFYGYVKTLCLGGVFEPSDLTHCTSRAATVFSYTLASYAGLTGVAMPTLHLLSDTIFNTFAITPELPEGLTFGEDATISGTPSVASDTTFTISGTNSVETKQFTLTLAITDNACPALDSFPQTANGATASSSTACPPNHTGTATRVCTNGAFGDVNYDGCVLDAPSAFSYSPASISVVSGEKVLSADPAVTGEVVFFSIAPSSRGLSVNSRGVVSGVVTTVGTTVFTITATNSQGSKTTTLSVTASGARCTGVEGVDVADGDKMMEECPAGTVGEAFRVCTNGVLGVLDRSRCHVAAPCGMSYSKTEYVATENRVFFTSYPVVNGTVAAFSIAPALPKGLSINTQNGIIIGAAAPGSSSSAGNVEYTVTASNESGETTTVLTIHVVPIMCEATEDLKAIAAGETLTFDCTSLSGYKGSYDVKCELDSDNMYAHWAKPSAWCVEKLSEFTLIGIILIIVGVLLERKETTAN